MTNKKPSVCLVTCYRDPGYIRVRTLEAGLLANNVNLSILRNKRRGFLRYVEVIIGLIRVRFSINPDVYLVTFRGYEILPFVLLIGAGKKVVFDEFINLVEWVVYEHKKLSADGFASKLLKNIYGFCLSGSDAILTDTSSHADFSSKIMGIPREKYQPIIVGTDESTFKENSSAQKVDNDDIFRVFYYGSMLPLHGVNVVLDAAKLLKGEKNMQITLIGGNEKTERTVNDAIKKGANIDYKSWVNFEDLPGYIQSADVCLAGPFGGTVQSQYVITGKAYQFLRMKRPIIVGDNKESHIFTDKKDAIIVKQADAAELAKAIEWACKHRSHLPDIGQAGYKLYQQKLSNGVLADQVKELLARF